ncbi:MAG TPA: Crp/Fnr family transcriptional regulator [Sphingomonadaceae bacterium]|nr:Crp/Fnr family transcriptional regulator [Sphingomonadaceae bacterium]
MIKPIHSGEVLFEIGSPAQNVIFPLDGLVSLRVPLKDGRLIENVAIGRDGLVGGLILLGQTRSVGTALTAISGRAAWLSLADLIAAMELDPGFKPAILENVSRLTQRLMQNVACAAAHSAAQRIATWLLHAEDRMMERRFDITQRMMADIFSLRPATVSDACNKLLSAGAIHYSRGKLSVMDRTLLEAMACECYAAVRAQEPSVPGAFAQIA